MKTPIRLTDKDWEILLPGEEYKIGTTKLTIVPLGIENVKEAVIKIREIQDDLLERGITEKNYVEAKNITYLTEVVLTKAPELLAESSGLHIDDVRRLPPAAAVGLVTKVLEVNIESQADLAKNLIALADTINSLTSSTESGTSVISSSAKATRSRKSKGTRSGK